MSGPPQTNKRRAPSPHLLLGMASVGAALPQMGLFSRLLERTAAQRHGRQSILGR